MITSDRITQIDPAGADTLAADRALLLDVREPEEWSAGHIPGAVHMPLGILDPAAIPHNRVVVAVCRSGNRSNTAAAVLADRRRGRAQPRGRHEDLGPARPPRHPRRRHPGQDRLSVADSAGGSAMEAAAWDARYAATELIWSAQPNRFVVQVLEARSPGTAVDLACGEGRNAVWLAQRGWTVTGVDFSAVALTKATQLAQARGVQVDWVLADATRWIPSAPVDLVVLAYLHLPAAARRTVLRSAATALRPGGTLLVVAHHSANLTEGTGGPQDPAVLYTAEDVVGDVAGLGLHTIQARRVDRPTADGPVAVDMLAELRRPGSDQP
jgi:rhodanese-related sulfurtransferase/SAM-dependent methyltransferase